MYSTDAIRPDPQAVLQGDTWRITVLTPRLVRLEYSQTGQFTDSATQLAADRHFPPAPFRVSECGGSLQLTTEFLRLTYDKGPFSSTGLTIQITGKDSLYASVWHYGDESHDLGGTARTLDEADGAIPLEHGVLSADGWSVLRDTGSGLVNEEGTISPRPAPTAEDLCEMLARYYEGEALVQVQSYQKEAAYLAANTMAGKDSLTLVVSGHEEQIIVTALFDNLGKGASGAAVQNMNLMLGFPETTGLSL